MREKRAGQAALGTTQAGACCDTAPHAARALLPWYPSSRMPGFGYSSAGLRDPPSSTSIRSALNRVTAPLSLLRCSPLRRCRSAVTLDESYTLDRGGGRLLAERSPLLGSSGLRPGSSRGEAARGRHLRRSPSTGRGALRAPGVPSRGSGLAPAWAASAPPLGPPSWGLSRGGLAGDLVAVSASPLAFFGTRDASVTKDRPWQLAG